MASLTQDFQAIQRLMGGMCIGHSGQVLEPASSSSSQSERFMELAGVTTFGHEYTWWAHYRAQLLAGNIVPEEGFASAIEVCNSRMSRLEQSAVS
mmetsp:Transcript_22189/g.54667  ORF Transcript_22189/g.54667 Transcript_22189/m.54667 type:complete len:95 (+) Transcript_22189:94-378(+)